MIPALVKIPGTTNRHRLLIYGGLILLILLGGGSFYEIRSDHFRAPAQSFLESMFDRRIEIGEASFTILGRVTVRDVRIYNPPGYGGELFVYAPSIRFMLGMTGGETSAFRPTRIVMEKPEFHYERTLTRPWNSENIWRKKAPRHDHPTFTLPVAIRDAQITFTDSRVGLHGINLAFDEVDVQFTVMSDGSEIKNFMTCQDVRAPGVAGGRFDLDISSHPNAGVSSTRITLRDVDVLPLKPWYEALGVFSFAAGKATGIYRMRTESGVLTTSADIQIRNANIRHVASGTVFNGITPHVRYDGLIGDTRITIRDLEIDWQKSIITGGGVFSNRYSPDTFIDFELTARDARAEDLSFLLCDPLFEAQGSVDGHCRLHSDTSRAAAHALYDVAFTLGRAEAGYSRLITKPPGVHLAVTLNGRSGSRPDRIRVELGGSVSELTPRGRAGWRVALGPLTGADVLAHIIPIGRIPDLVLEGPITATLDLEGAGRLSGTIDLTPTAVRAGVGFVKPAGDVALLDLAGILAREKLTAENCTARLGKSRLSLNGNWSPDAIDIELGIVEMGWTDAIRYLPQLSFKLGDKVRLSGTLAGLIRMRTPERSSPDFTSQASGATPLQIESRLDLGLSDIEFEGFGRKKKGIASSLSFDGVLQPGSLLIRDGILQVQSTALAMAGDFSPGACNLALRGRGTGFDGLRTILASQFWPPLKNVEAAGAVDLDATAAARGDELRISAELNATTAVLSYADSWIKPLGETFRVRSMLASSAAGTTIERLEFTQGTSTLRCEGHIGSGRPAVLTGVVSADIDVPVFLKRAHGLDRMKVDGRRASDALTMIADNRNRAALNWDLSGSIEEPRLALVMDQIMSRVIANAISRQLRAITNIVTSPVRIGGEIMRDIFSSDTRTPQKER